MLKFLKILIFISISLTLVFFLNESSPSIAVEIADKKIRTTIFLFCLAVLILLTITYIVLKALYSALTLPFTLKKNYQKKLNEGKFLSLVDMCIAKEQMDSQQFKKALSFIMSADIPDYVKAWLNYQQYSNSNVQRLEELLQYPQTATLAIIQLIKLEISLGNTKSALNHFKNPSISFAKKWRSAMIVKLCFKDSAWSNLVEILTKEKHIIPNKEYLLDICYFKMAKEIYESKIAFEKLREALLILDKIKTVFLPAIQLKAMLFIQLTEYDMAIKFIHKNWGQYSNILLEPTLILLRELDQKSQFKILDKIIENDPSSGANIILIIYRAIISVDIQLTTKLINQYRHTLEERYISFFEYYYKSLKQDKIILDLFLGNLIALITLKNFYFEFAWSDDLSIEKELIAIIKAV